jgi:hypothetical protein
LDFFEFFLVVPRGGWEEGGPMCAFCAVWVNLIVCWGFVCGVTWGRGGLLRATVRGEVFTKSNVRGEVFTKSNRQGRGVY